MAIPIDDPNSILYHLVGHEALCSSPDTVDTWLVSRSTNADRKRAALEEWGKQLVTLLDKRGIEVRFK